MIQRLVITGRGERGRRAVRSLPRPFCKPGMFAEAGVDGPRPGRPVRIPLGAMRWRTGGDGQLTWTTEVGTAAAAYFEISVD